MPICIDEMSLEDIHQGNVNCLNQWYIYEKFLLSFTVYLFPLKFYNEKVLMVNVFIL